MQHILLSVSSQALSSYEKFLESSRVFKDLKQVWKILKSSSVLNESGIALKYLMSKKVYPEESWRVWNGLNLKEVLKNLKQVWKNRKESQSWILPDK